MQELRPAQLLHVAERRDERLDVVAVDRTDVVEAHLLEQGAGQHHALQMLLRTARQLPHGGHLTQDLFAALAKMRIHASRQRPRQVVGQRADVLRNRHVVVVQDDQEVRGRRACMVERLEGHTRGKRAVADDCNRAPILAAFGGRDRHAERGADRGTGVAHTERVVLALASRRKRREAAVLLDGVQQLAPPGQHFVRVGLMAHVPDQPVIWRIEYVVKGDVSSTVPSPRRNVRLGCSRSGSKTAAARRRAPGASRRQAAEVRGQLMDSRSG